MRRFGLLALMIVSQPVSAQDVPLDPDGDVEIQIEGDLNGDGLDDVVLVTRHDDDRALIVRLSYKSEVDFGLDAGETLPLEPTSLGPASLKISRGVLTLEDLTGGEFLYPHALQVVDLLYRFTNRRDESADRRGCHIVESGDEANLAELPPRAARDRLHGRLCTLRAVECYHDAAGDGVDLDLPAAYTH